MNSNRMFNSKDIVRIAIPVFFDQLSAILMGAIDSAMVSNRGEAVVSGVSIVDPLNYVILTLLSALAVGGSVVVAQYIGSGDRQNSVLCSMQTIIITVLPAILLSLPCIFFSGNILNMVYGSMDAQIFPHAVGYFTFIAIGNPFFAIYLACSAIMRANGNTKPIMIVSCTINVLNVIGNATFIYGFDMGAVGAALSTSFCRVVGAALMIYMLFFKTKLVAFHGREMIGLDFSMMKRILTIAIPTAIENMMFNVGTLIIRRFMVSIPNSTVELAANAVASNIYNLILIFGNTLSTSLMPIIGQCIGAERKDEAKTHTRNFIFIITAINVVASLVVFLLFEPIVAMYGIGEDATQIAYNIVALSCAVIPVMWAAAGVLPSAFRSSGDIKFPLVITMVDMWVVRVGLGYYFCNVCGMGAFGIWIATYLDWIIKDVAYIIRYKSGKWLEKKVI